MFFFFNDTATTEIYTLSLHDALPISDQPEQLVDFVRSNIHIPCNPGNRLEYLRSEEHTSELQSRQYLVCRLLLEKKKKNPLPSYPAAFPSVVCSFSRDQPIY